MKRISILISILAYLPILFKFSDMSGPGIYLLISFGLYGILGYFCIYGLLRKLFIDWSLSVVIVILVFIATSYTLGGCIFILRKYTEFLDVYPWYYLLFNQILLLTLISKSIKEKCRK